MRKQRLIVSTVASVGGQDAVMVLNFAATLREFWAALHQYGRSPRIAAQGQWRLQQVVGSISALWSLLEELQTRRLEDPATATVDLANFLSEPGLRASITDQACRVLSMTADRRAALLSLADKSPRGDGRGAKLAAKVLETGFWKIIETGILADMPNSNRLYSMFLRSFDNYCLTVIGLYDSISGDLADPETDTIVKTALGTTLGFSIFEGVRGQKEGRIDPGKAGLMSYYRLDHIRRRRGFFAVVGRGVHDLSMSARELQQLSQQSHRSRVAVQIKDAETKLRQGVFDVFATGLLSAYAL